ncbi:MAG: cytidine deaminase [Bacteroidetes bacterium]|nr:cytidine deaminase [Bacteroidota bacterium]
MKKTYVQSEFLEFDSVDELAEEDRKLVYEARKTAHDAYAPYSNFHVGAIVLLVNGVTVIGNNQENASYPLGLCAERVAIFAAGATYPGIKIKSIAITASSDQFNIDQPVAPCGACRQAIAEYEHRYQHPIRLILTGESGKVLVADGIKNFLPHLFDGDSLKAK